MATQAPRRTVSSWVQLGLFTAFLFLLVAIPYTIYLKASEPKAAIHIAQLPPKIVQPSPQITPPAASATTTCLSVAPNYVYNTATPAAYLFKNNDKANLCFPPVLPPFPFTWQKYTDLQHGFSIDTPSNWDARVKTIAATSTHIFSADATTTTSATVSFTLTAVDQYATDSSYLKQSVTKNGEEGTIYTQGTASIVAVFPLNTKYFVLQSSQEDNAFYAFQHMLDSLHFSK